MIKWLGNFNIKSEWQWKCIHLNIAKVYVLTLQNILQPYVNFPNYYCHIEIIPVMNIHMRSMWKGEKGERRTGRERTRSTEDKNSSFSSFWEIFSLSRMGWGSRLWNWVPLETLYFLRPLIKFTLCLFPFPCQLWNHHSCLSCLLLAPNT